MRSAADIRRIRAGRKQTQVVFASEFPANLKVTRYDIINWERFGVADSDVEKRLEELENDGHEVGSLSGVG